MAEPGPSVSIIIRTFNEERRLPALLDGLASQRFRDFETIVVDSGSFDRTLEIAQSRVDQVVRIKSADFTFGHSLNEGIRRSRGRLLAIVSAHTEPIADTWLESLVAPFADETVAMVYGLQRGRLDESKFGEWTDFFRTFGPEAQVLRPPHFFANNANAAVRRSLWETAPFDEMLPGLEDAAWAKHWMEQGYRVVYAPLAGIVHIHQETWPQVRRRYYREGQAARWIGVRARRELPREAFKESRALASDVVRALCMGRLSRTLPEIVRFRYEKLTGTIAGIWNGALMENQVTRAETLFGKSHKAVVIHGVASASLDEVATPALKPSDVLVRVAFQGVCATDLEILDGHLGYYKTGQASYPIIPGHEFSGTVAAVGARVEGLRPGDRVVVECIQGCGECEACRRGNWIGCATRREVGVIGRDGGYQEYMVSPAQFIHKIPDTLGLLPACLCEPVAVVLKGLRRMDRAHGPTRDQAVAVVGGGPIGHLAARILAQRGHAVTVFDRSERRRDYLAGSTIRTAAELSELSGFQSVVEATGDPVALETILHRTDPGTTVLLLGLPYAHRLFSFETIVGFDKVVVGSVGSSAEDFEEAIHLLPQIDTTAFTEKIVPLEQYAHAWALSRERSHLKVILRVDEVA